MSLTGNATAKVLRGRINRLDTLIVNAYEIAVKNGFKGTEEEWLESLKGESGYQIAVRYGYTGTEEEFFADLTNFATLAEEAKAAEKNAKASEVSASASATSAANNASATQSAKTDAQQAANDAATSQWKAAQSEAAAKLAADQCEASVSGVASFNGRGGHVMPQSGDYTADMVGAVSTSGGMMTGNLKISTNSYGQQLEINRNGQYDAVIKFSNSSKTYGTIGFSHLGEPVVRYGDDNQAENHLIHNNNVYNYTTPVHKFRPQTILTQGWYRLGEVSGNFSGILTIGGLYGKHRPGLDVVLVTHEAHDFYVNSSGTTRIMPYSLRKLAYGSSGYRQFTKSRLCKVDGKTYLDIYYGLDVGNIAEVGIQTLFGTFTPNSVNYPQAVGTETIEVEEVLDLTEWINPPMQLGVEYRTTERYLGKPVYVKVVDFGSMPNATTKTLSHGIANIAYPISAYGCTKDGWSSIPSTGIENSAGILAAASFTNTQIRVWCKEDWTTNECYITIKYTKTTD